MGWEGPSFPSGHAAAAAAAWPAIALVLGRGCPRVARALLAAAAALIAVAVAASRALLGVHWLTDIVAGVAIGYGWFLICAVMFGGRAQRLGDPLKGNDPRAHRLIRRERSRHHPTNETTQCWQFPRTERRGVAGRRRVGKMSDRSRHSNKAGYGGLSNASR